jgi:hypothetical protein
MWSIEPHHLWHAHVAASSSGGVEPVLVALIGVAGLLVGAIASGVVQAILAALDRRRRARSAARLLYMRLHEAAQAIEELRVRRDWHKMITDWDSFGAAWDKYSEALAHTLKTKDFEAVSSAFSGIASLARARATDQAKSPPAPFTVPNDQLVLWAANAAVARDIVYGVSFTAWEKWRGKDSVTD